VYTPFKKFSRLLTEVDKPGISDYSEEYERKFFIATGEKVPY